MTKSIRNRARIKQLDTHAHTLNLAKYIWYIQTRQHTLTINGKYYDVNELHYLRCIQILVTIPQSTSTCHAIDYINKAKCEM